MDERTEQIAREAARLIELGQSDDVVSAVRAAAEHLGLRDVPWPRPGRVREHARGFAMQRLGEAGYRERVHGIWRVAEELMTVLDAAFPDAPSLLVGRAARGQIDAGVTIHLRLYTHEPMSAVVDVLMAHEYGEPAFETAHTRFGRLDRVRLDEDGQEIVLTRCPPDPAGRLHPKHGADRDLFDGRPIAIASLRELRERLES